MCFVHIVELHSVKYDINVHLSEYRIHIKSTSLYVYSINDKKTFVTI